MASRKSKSRNWHKRQRSDPYVRAAQNENYRSRAAYKLAEIEARYQFLQAARTIVDLGSAPGSWSQLARRVSPQARIIACDRLAMAPISGVQFLQIDFCGAAGGQALEVALAGRRAEVILSDMAPNLTGISAADEAGNELILNTCLAFAERHLAPEGTLLCKCFNSASLAQTMAQARQSYGKLKICKPESSRSASSEVYLLLRGKR